MSVTASDYTDAAMRFDQAVREEMSAWCIPGVSAVLIDGDRIVHLAAFGEAKTNSIFRCGSISKLFNAVAVFHQAFDQSSSGDHPCEIPSANAVG